MTTNTDPRAAFIAEYVADVRQHPQHYKARITADPEAEAAALSDGLTDDEVRAFLKALRDERRALARHGH